MIVSLRPKCQAILRFYPTDSLSPIAYPVSNACSYRLRGVGTAYVGRRNHIPIKVNPYHWNILFIHHLDALLAIHWSSLAAKNWSFSYSIVMYMHMPFRSN
ncbi:hypothetical protein TNCV_3682161 [Trichonephila clavipes]|uniref:Uncharacterized protein n=1 Tax=Trichonephila clavipes TaxID=2585209 RepID=A0A8X6RCM0_TRICX|nr:hypothetical protein TNCV_3682161 [Trichonephila clavipes]